ncbi:ASCH domain-containing protein [Actinomadura madurae]|uniref:ASCH domain-containing protein n=1 Tax=Actinomadura madurae TaxID=1993 RepID=UPI0020D23F3B|nr:ASCH domain-containing protein [Actinomadura madurae]MCP9947334.1 ASCH domain-containing protein [Actinomadura madurae]MCP9964100.1 ASCH domain-containing protein [Actinomadura madurae]MCP9976571.1 ASCH domain-containing protein [Actinomadura madurae]MCQ0011931.1 ASCH domain-containing protein [Actinomadura madurae]MCQ0012767.1 ASCH domain-containing protein [Actinomadura madurae]
MADKPRDRYILALTIWNPWAAMIADGYKTIENRSWGTHRTGLLAIHAAVGAGTRTDQEHAIATAARLASLPRDVVERSMEVRGAVIAVARLTGVCSLSLHVPPGEPLACDCGPWAFPGQRHFRLTSVRALPEPVPCCGAQKFWELPDDVYEAILPTAKKVAREGRPQ